MKFELFIAWRYLRSKRRTAFISVITYLSIIGVIIGSAVLIIVLSVMNGFEYEVRRRIINADAHIRVVQYHSKPFSDYLQLVNNIRSLPHIIGTSPFIEEKGLLVSPDGSMGVAVRGVIPEMINTVSNFDTLIVMGRSFSRVDSGLPGIAVGLYIQDNLNLEVGDTLSLISPSGLFTGLMVPRTMRFRVDGVFETGLMEYDNLYCYISLSSAQRLFNMSEQVQGIDIKLDDLYLADQVKSEIVGLLGDYPFVPYTWFEMKPNLYNWMKIEKWMMSIVLSLIILVAVFNITSSLIMLVLEKKRDIGILKALGADIRTIRRIFTYEGLVAGVLGGTAGIFLGFVICYLQYRYHFIKLPGDVYIINFFPILMRWPDFVLVWITAVALSFIAAYYPAYKASKLEAAEAIRYE